MASVERKKVFKVFSKFDKHGYTDGFSESTRYWVRNPDNNKLYPQKTIFGYAANLKQRDCDGATDTRKALEKAGFEIVDTRAGEPCVMGLPDAADQPPKGKEGATTQITSNKYERDPKLRDDCANHYFAKFGRLACQVCDMDFQSRYGDIGRDFIHIHHLDPLGDGQGEREIDPIEDLVPVCPNCHAMLHKKTGKENVYTLDELKKMLKGKA